jgi:hypothetical protein
MHPAPQKNLSPSTKLVPFREIRMSSTIDTPPIDLARMGQNRKQRCDSVGNGMVSPALCTYLSIRILSRRVAALLSAGGICYQSTRELGR